MTRNEIINSRLINQRLNENKFKKPVEVVSYLGAMQAQDYSMAKWAIGLRCQNSDEEKIEMSINKGEIIRTHIFRPTWHFVSVKDIRWMMELASPHMKKSLSSSHKKLELDEKTFVKSNKIIDKLLESGEHFTREEIMSELKRKGIVTNSLRAIHIMFRAEIDMIVCNGNRREKQFTYSHFDKRVPSVKPIARDEAIGKLVMKYFKSRSPATLSDFIWWSGLPAADAKSGLEMNKSSLVKETMNGTEYWMNISHESKQVTTNNYCLLPAYDEYSVSYKDRSAILDAKYEKRAGNGIFFPPILISGKIVGTWKRSFKKEKVIIEMNFFETQPKKTKKLIASAANRYGHFMGHEVEII